MFLSIIIPSITSSKQCFSCIRFINYYAKYKTDIEVLLPKTRKAMEVRNKFKGQVVIRYGDHTQATGEYVWWLSENVMIKTHYYDSKLKKKVRHRLEMFDIPDYPLQYPVVHRSYLETINFFSVERMVKTMIYVNLVFILNLDLQIDEKPKQSIIDDVSKLNSMLKEHVFKIKFDE